MYLHIGKFGVFWDNLVHLVFYTLDKFCDSLDKEAWVGGKGLALQGLMMLQNVPKCWSKITDAK